MARAKSLFHLAKPLGWSEIDHQSFAVRIPTNRAKPALHRPPGTGGDGDPCVCGFRASQRDSLLLKTLTHITVAPATAAGITTKFSTGIMVRVAAAEPKPSAVKRRWRSRTR